MPNRSRRPAFFWLVVGAIPLYAALWLFSGHVLVRDFHHSKAYGWTLAADDTGWVFTSVDPNGAAAGRLEVGDRMRALNGDTNAAVLGYLFFANAPVGQIYHLDVDRRGTPVAMDLLMAEGPGRQLWLVFVIVSITFFIVGAALGVLRPEDPQVRLIAGLMIAAACGMILEVLGGNRSFLVGWERSVNLASAATALFVFPMTYHFFCRFPEWRSPGPIWRAIQYVLYALLAVVFLPAWLLNFLSLDLGEGPTRFLVTHPALFHLAYRIQARPLFVFVAGSLALAILVAARNYSQLRDPDSRRRVRWVVASLVVGCFPYIVVIVLYRVASAMSDAVYRFYYPVTFLTMLAIPAALAMAVWQEQLFDVRVLVRRGLQYLFARTALRVLLVLPIALLLFSIFKNPDRTVAQILTQGSGWLNIALIGAIGVALQSRQRLQTSLDRRFFREAYHQEQILVQLIDEVRQRDSLADIARLVSARIDSVLHPSAIHVFYRAEERSDRFEGHSSSDVLAPPQLSEQRTLLGLVGAGTGIREFPAGFDGTLPDDERGWLEQLAVRVIVPITGTRERLVGVLLLGVRMSDEPYSATDLRLLQGIAAQIGLVYENQHLQERVRMDADVRRDVLARLEERSVSLLKECPVCGACYESTADRCEHDAAELALTLPIERTLDGKYRLERALGRGGFGAVFQASDLRLHRQVAAKVMMGSLFGDPAALRRFEREARAAAKIDHPAITRVHDYGAVGSGGAYLIMELVAGRTWRAELRRSGVIAPARAAGWFRQLLDGLQFAHAMGIVHRDLKPENVMVVETSTGDALKIMDFGLAKVLDPGTGVTESVTVAGTAIGTLGYMAPEVLTGGLVDERADIFAVGVMVVETLTGTRPFGGSTQQEILLALLQSDYHLPGDSAETRRLDAIVQRCLAKDPRDRYGTTAEVATDLVPALAGYRGFAAHPGLTISDSPTLGEPNKL
jgi:hypothetical protein